MGFSQEVRFKIGGEVGSSLRASFSQATTMAEKAGKQMEKSFAAIDKITSNKGLLDFRRRVAFEEASTVGRIKITQERMAALSHRIAQTETGTTKQKKLQLDFDKERAKLAILRRQQAESNQGGGGSAAPAEEGGASGGGGLGIGRLAFRAIGGAIAFGLERVIAWNQSRTRVEEARGESNAAGLASLRNRFAATGGLSSQLRQGEGTIKDLERQKQFQQNRSDFLSSGVQGVLSHLNSSELEKSDKAIAEINAKIQQQHDANALIEKDLKRQNELRKTLFGFSSRSPGKTIEIDAKPSGSIPETSAAARAGRLSEIKKEQIELKRLQGVLRAEINYGGAGSEASRDARVAVEAQRVKVDQSRQAARQRLLEVNQDLTGQATEGRSFRDGARRPLSESERIARRAQMFRTRAQNAILTGASGEAPHLLQSAIRDEATVAGRLSRASSKVKPLDVGDSSGIKPELLRSNQLLEAIKKSLEVVNVD